MHLSPHSFILTKRPKMTCIITLKNRLTGKAVVTGFVPILLLLLSLSVPAAATEFLLFYGNDVHGETAPCG